MSRERKKPRVYKEDAKTQHTAHWDWDYLPWKEIERRLKQAGVREDERAVPNGKHLRQGRRGSAVWIALGVLILAGVLLAVMIR
jgi:hypothetical protein